MRFLLLILTLGLVGARGGLAQAGAGQADGRTTLQAGSTLVLVPAMVRTKAGSPVFSLSADDFVVTDDGAVQKAKLEADQGDQPLALVVVVETGGSGRNHLGDYRGLGTMVESVVGGVEHRVAVIDFDSQPELDQAWTGDMDLVNTAVNEMEPGDDGAAVLDALGAAVNLLKKQPSEYRRAILLVSETVDQGSKLKLEDAVKVLSDTNTTIYSVGFSSTRSGVKHEAGSMLSNPEPGPAGGCFSRSTEPAEGTDTTAEQAPQQSRLEQAYGCVALLVPPIRLARMAALIAANSLKKNVPETVAGLTGGEYARFKNSKTLEQGLLKISNNLPNRYVLSFEPTTPHAGLHVLGVRLKDAGGRVVTARGSYWADTAATGAHM